MKYALFDRNKAILAGLSVGSPLPLLDGRSFNVGPVVHGYDLFCLLICFGWNYKKPTL